MPVVNASGSIIHEKVDPKPYLRFLKWPGDREAIYHLSRTDFMDWFYGLTPTEAMLLSGMEDFKKVIFYQHNKSKLSELADYIWRHLSWD